MKLLHIFGIIILSLLVLALVLSLFLAESQYGHAETRWVKATYWKEGGQYKARVKFNDNLDGVSAVHIHKDDNGKIGPIIAWLATSDTWNNGYLQSQKDGNSPCCALSMCSRENPTQDTLSISQAEDKTLELDIPQKGLSDECDAYHALKHKKVFLVVHGTNISDKPPGDLDVIEHSKFM